MALKKYCRQKNYKWSPEIDRKYKFLLRSAKIKNYDSPKIDKIILKLLKKNKYILSRRKSERLNLAIQSVEIVLKRQITRK